MSINVSPLQRPNLPRYQTHRQILFSLSWLFFGFRMSYMGSGVPVRNHLETMAGSQISPENDYKFANCRVFIVVYNRISFEAVILQL